MLKTLFKKFNRAQNEAKKDIAREEHRRSTLIKDLNSTGFSDFLDLVEDTKKGWEKEDRRKEAIDSFLDL